jgi:L-fuculose-phosphate aldolase
MTATVDERHVRQALVGHGVKLLEDGLAIGTAGNLSVRLGERVLITPSGIPYDETRPEDCCVLDLDANVLEPGGPPSSETPMHLTIYRHTNAGAVVHTHSPFATALSTVLDELPPVHYALAGLGGPIRVAPYATFGSGDLARNMLVALEGRSAAILQNHGTIAYGRDLAQAYLRAQTLEWVCEVYWRAKTFGEPKLLPVEELDRVRELARGHRGFRRDELASAGAGEGR